MWAPPAGTLGDLVSRAYARSSVLGEMPSRDSIRRARTGMPSMISALASPDVSIIAEVKRSSPSKGVIDAAIRSGARALEYESGGASAVSVLTEPDGFSGRDDDIADVRSATSIPILKKDFHVTPAQLIQAAHLGASAALVILRAIEPSRLSELTSTAEDVTLELLYEIRDERELDRALAVNAKMIGVNNRNLETLVIDSSTVERLIPLIPPDRIAIAESGYSSREDVERAARAGADAVLVGSSLSASSDASQAVRALTGIPRIHRGH